MLTINRKMIFALTVMVDKKPRTCQNAGNKKEQVGTWNQQDLIESKNSSAGTRRTRKQFELQVVPNS